MDHAEMRTELVELVLEHLENQHSAHKWYTKHVLKLLEGGGPKTATELEQYKPKQYTLPEVLQLTKQLENYVLTGAV